MPSLEDSSLEDYALANAAWIGGRRSGIVQWQDGTRRQRFDNGVVYQRAPGHPTIGYVPHGPIFQAWKRAGLERGAFGFPNSAVTGELGACRTTFQHGEISRAPGAGPAFGILAFHGPSIGQAGTFGGGGTRSARISELPQLGESTVVAVHQVVGDDRRAGIAECLRRAGYVHRLARPGGRCGGADGGFLLFSKVPIAAGSLSHDGVVSARLDLSGLPGAKASSHVDLYLADMAAVSDAEKQRRAAMITSFDRSHQERDTPAVLAGFSGSGFVSDAWGWHAQLGSADDEWLHMVSDEPSGGAGLRGSLRRRPDHWLLRASDGMALDVEHVQVLGTAPHLCAPSDRFDQKPIFARLRLVRTTQLIHRPAGHGDRSWFGLRKGAPTGRWTSSSRSARSRSARSRSAVRTRRRTS